MKKFIYFSASWCGPCRTLGPIMDDLSTQANVQKVDVDSDKEMAAKYKIRSVPVVVLLENGTEIQRYIGVNLLQTYLNALN
jgi:thioredoxin 1